MSETKSQPEEEVVQPERVASEAAQEPANSEQPQLRVLQGGRSDQVGQPVGLDQQRFERVNAPEVVEKPLHMVAAGVYTFLNDVVKGRDAKGFMPILTQAELAKFEGNSEDPLIGYCAGLLGAASTMAAKATVSRGSNGENAESLQQLIDAVETGGFVFQRLAKDQQQEFVNIVANINPTLFEGIGPQMTQQEYAKVLQWVDLQFKAAKDALIRVKRQMEGEAMNTEGAVKSTTKNTPRPLDAAA